MAEPSAFRPRRLAVRSRWRGRLAAAALALAAVSARAADVSVTASVDQNRVAAGESIVLSIDVAGAQNVGAPDLGNLVGFQARYLGPATQVSIVNGQVSASVSHRYSLLAQKEGRFALGPFRVEYGGNAYQTNPLEVQVLPRSSAGGGQPGFGNEQLRLVLRPARSEIWAGERIPLDLKLYVGDVRVDDLQFPQVSGDGVTIDKLGQPNRQTEVVAGRRYQTLGFATALTALRPGAIPLDATMAMNVIVPRRRGGDRFFDGFFGDSFGERRAVEVRADTVPLTVRPLPDTGRPADFSGAVGRFDFTLTAKPTEVAAGDPVTVEMRIAGEGDLTRVGAPRIAAGEHFRAYDAQPQKDKESESARVFEQVFIPKEAGSLEIPAARFSYFDTEAGAYRTITQGPVRLSVRAAAAGERPAVLSAAEPAPRAAEAPAPLGRDVVYIKDTPGRLAPPSAPFHASVRFALLQAAPPIGFLALLLVARRRERLGADPRLVRFRRAGSEARQRLGALSRGAAANDAFYDELAAALTAYLGAKLDLPPGAVDRERVIGRLSANGSAEDLRESVERFFALVEGARYAPGAAGQGDREAALDLASGIVERLERARRTSGRLPFVLALLLSATIAAPVLAAEPNTLFFQGNAAYGEGRYADAARLYEQVLAAGRESAELYFNLGNAHFKNHQLGRAILNYERARRRAPRDPDVRANLAYAEEVAETTADEPALWQRLACPLAFRATARELAFAFTAVWWAFWALLCARLYADRVRAGLGRAAAVAAVLVVLFATSLTFRVAVLERAGSAVVTAAGETAVRFEPSDTGTEHFRAREGTLLDVTEEREGWAQVRRRDGLRGWIRAETLTPVEGPRS